MKSLSPSMLAWMRSFEATARLGSVTRAAGELCVTQGAVSQQVRHLEKALGFPLLVRWPGRLELTPEGRRLAPVASQALAALRDIVADIATPGGMIPVTLSCSPSFAIQWLAPRLGHLLLQQPNVDLRVFGEFHHLDRARMGAEGLEAAIRYDLGAYPDLEASPILDEFLVAVASPAFLAARPKIAPGAEMDGRFLLHDARPWFGAEDAAEWQDFLIGAGLKVRDLNLGKRFNLSQLALGAALANEGIAIGRLAIVLEELRSGRLLPALPVAVRSRAAYHFIAPRERPARISAVHRWLVEEGGKFRERRDVLLKDYAVVGA